MCLTSSTIVNLLRVRKNTNNASYRRTDFNHIILSLVCTRRMHYRCKLTAPENLFKTFPFHFNLSIAAIWFSFILTQNALSFISLVHLSLSYVWLLVQCLSPFSLL